MNLKYQDLVSIVYKPNNNRRIDFPNGFLERKLSPQYIAIVMKWLDCQMNQIILKFLPICCV